MGSNPAYETFSRTSHSSAAHLFLEGDRIGGSAPIGSRWARHDRVRFDSSALHRVPLDELTRSSGFESQSDRRSADPRIHAKVGGPAVGATTCYVVIQAIRLVISDTTLENAVRVVLTRACYPCCAARRIGSTPTFSARHKISRRRHPRGEGESARAAAEGSRASASRTTCSVSARSESLFGSLQRQRSILHQGGSLGR